MGILDLNFFFLFFFIEEKYKKKKFDIFWGVLCLGCFIGGEGGGGLIARGFPRKAESGKVHTG